MNLSQFILLPLLMFLLIVGTLETNALPPGVMEEQKKILNEVLTKNPVQKQKDNIKPITVIGEVIDVWCYMSQTMGPGRGESHMACAAKCGIGGIPLGILEDKTNNVFVAAKSNRPYTGCNKILLPYVGKKVKVNGYVARRGGCQVLRIERVSVIK